MGSTPRKCAGPAPDHSPGPVEGRRTHPGADRSPRARPLPPPAAPLPVSTMPDDSEAWLLLPGEVPDRVWDSRIHGFGAADRHANAVIPTTIPGFDE